MEDVVALVASISILTQCCMLCTTLAVPAAVRVALVFCVSHQAGSCVNALATYMTLGGRARVAVDLLTVVPIVGWLRRSTILTPEIAHHGLRKIFDSQVGFVTEGVYYVVVGAATFGWTSVAGWPVAILGLLTSILAKPWVEALSSA